LLIVSNVYYYGHRRLKFKTYRPKPVRRATRLVKLRDCFAIAAVIRNQVPVLLARFESGRDCIGGLSQQDAELKIEWALQLFDLHSRVLHFMLAVVVEEIIETKKACPAA
jgi:hypothetical protein